MDEILSLLIASAPNMLVALWVLWRDDKRITQLLESQKWLIEQLMAMHPPQEENGENNLKETD